jgi:GntP family gluconate:H+ symporter
MSVMDIIPAFVMAVLLVSLLTVKIGLSPFMSLLVSALAYGLLTGMGPELIGTISTGLGRIFAALAVIVFSGSVIAEHLRQSRGVERVVADLLGLVGRDRGILASGLSGYLVALPAMCSITSYMILEPVVRGMGQEAERSGKRYLFAAALFSVISFNLVYPSPVMITLTGSLEVSPAEAVKFGLPLSLLLFIPAFLCLRRLPVVEEEAPAEEGALPPRLLSWAPLALPLVLIVAGLLSSRAWLVGSPNVALLAGALLSAVLARGEAEEMIKRATRRAGIIIFDLCGAGAFGYVIAKSGLGPELYRELGPLVPAVVLPFLVASLIQLAQGSRVVTVVIASEITKGYPLEPITLLFLISAGAFVLSSLSDPYFWLVKETTNSDLKEIIIGYTLPLSILGIFVFAATVLRWHFFV